MKIKSHLLAFSLSCCLMSIGCSGTSEGDTSPSPETDPQARANNAAKGIEASNMTPEQKKAAIQYLNQGATGAQKMKETAGAVAQK